MDPTDILRKRSILFSVRMRFSPQTQPIRESAVDRIVEQNLLLADEDKGLTLRQLEEQGFACFAGGTPVLSRADMEESLRRLTSSGSVISTGQGVDTKYKLSEKARDELWQKQRYAESRLGSVVQRLFKNAQKEPSAYVTPFLHCLCLIFSRLSENNVRLIKGELSHDELAQFPSVMRALEEVRSEYESLEWPIFNAAVYSFFRDEDPKYREIKWNMAQNYYVAKALGLDPSGRLLSKEVFGDASFYLDTNVVIQALEPIAQHHRSFEALGMACDQLQIRLNVCQVSLDELRRAVYYNRDLLAKVAEQIPEDTAPKIRGVFYQLYREELTRSGTVNFEELFSSFSEPRKKLELAHGVQLVDEVWFDEARSERETEKLVEEIRAEYLRKRGRRKGKEAALHDALLLRWIELERERSGSNSSLVTLDTSLPSFLPKSGARKDQPLAITLDALIQWISPIAMRPETEDEFAAVFSNAVKYQLLPTESFFELNDFLVFAEMEWSCKELPARDVEECIRYVKKTVPQLDPSLPADREKMAHEIAKFFADPGRKYKQGMQDLEAKLAQLYERGKKREEEYDQNVARLHSDVSRRDEKIASIEEELAGRREETRRLEVKRSARSRTGLVVFLFLIYEALALVAAHSLGEGLNILQKAMHSWPLLALGVPIAGFLFMKILGKERIRALGWPFDKFFKDV